MRLKHKLGDSTSLDLSYQTRQSNLSPFMNFIFRISLVSMLILCALITLAGAATGPNVIIILADDMGYGDLACFGHPHFKTPNLDRMAVEGCRLSQFNCPAPFCAPTRASLMTG